MVIDIWLQIDKPKKMEIGELYVVQPAENHPYTRVIS